MSTLTVSIPPEVEAFVRSVASARGETGEDFLRQHLIESASRYASLSADLQKGIDSLAEGREVPADEVFARLRTRVASK